jgi:hypothetical protein
MTSNFGFSQKFSPIILRGIFIQGFRDIKNSASRCPHTGSILFKNILVSLGSFMKEPNFLSCLEGYFLCSVSETNFQKLVVNRGTNHVLLLSFPTSNFWPLIGLLEEPSMVFSLGQDKSPTFFFR